MTCRPSPSRLRPGYTLLEVLLAAAISALLLAGLYAAMNMLYRHADTGRGVVEQSTYAQGIIQRLNDDISTELAPLPPSPNSSSGSGGSGSGGSGMTGGTGTTGNSPNTAAAATGSASSPSTSGPGAQGAPGTSGDTTTTNANAGGGGPVTFNVGVQGDDSHLTLYVSRFPREVAGTDAAGNQANLSDLRRVSYWLEGDRGLVRQEIKQATSADALNSPNYSFDNYSEVLSDRVKSVTFSYWDGSGWNDSWDGTEAGPDGTTTPKGPPMAIRVEIKVAPAGPGADDAKTWKVYRQTISLLTANRLTQNPNQTTNSTTGSNTNSNTGTNP